MSSEKKKDQNREKVVQAAVFDAETALGASLQGLPSARAGGLVRGRFTSSPAVPAPIVNVEEIMSRANRTFLEII